MLAVSILSATVRHLDFQSTADVIVIVRVTRDGKQQQLLLLQLLLFVAVVVVLTGTLQQFLIANDKAPCLRHDSLI